LKQIEHGQLEIRDEDGRRQFGDPDSSETLRASVMVLNPRFYGTVAFRGSIGAGEAYMEGDWKCDDLTAAVRIFARNRRLLEHLESGLARLFSPIYRAYHRRRRNTRHGSRKNISEHYDLGNDFFSLFLDDTLMYSCAYFESDSSTLLEASISKLDKVCQQLRLSPNDHLLEIGSGWGGLAIHAAEKYGCSVTTTTVSQEQYDLTRRRVDEAGLTGRISVLMQDYRDLTGSYDKLVSLEMIEAVGDEYLDLYFQQCARLLKPGGKLLIQAITIAPEFYAESRRNVDFIKRYIFPGSSLPSIETIRSSAERTGELQLKSSLDLTDHYPPTLRTWRKQLLANVEKVRDMGFSEDFIRMWEFYFCYCEAGFLERHIEDYQFFFQKTGRSDG
jgi:cyclopropane-fatty-acyl-phospholipid synthase